MAISSITQPRELPRELVAEPITAYRVWGVYTPRSVELDAEMLALLADDYDAGRNPFRRLIGARLCGIGNGAPWLTPVHHARCSASSYGPFFTLSLSASPAPSSLHDSPANGCSCGVWALKNPRDAWLTRKEYHAGRRLALGRVQLWGRVIEHNRGYRAEYARPLSLLLLGGTQKQADELAAFYRCEVKVRSGKLLARWLDRAAKAAADDRSRWDREVAENYAKQKARLELARPHGEQEKRRRKRGRK